ncbi:MAG: SpoVA/SpoVAEb family sporulation membrane protein [Ruminococcus sp.]|nr:SpoVA/SpoVAEb family sporulation membrane protein [Ruminococcus sp.]
MIYLYSFLVGGTLCLIGQALIDFTALTPARILTAYVVCGVFLWTIGVYQPLMELAGGGASVPLTGFGAALAKGVKQAVDEQGFVGIFTGGFTAAAAGISAALLFGALAALVRFKIRDSAVRA